MPPILMLIFCTALVALLLHIERKGNPSASLALWIPTLYMLILGSRPVGSWFGLQTSTVEAGSPMDMAVLITLLVFALIVLFWRKNEWSLTLKNNFALIFLYAFVGISILWSDYTFLSFKRWIRLLLVIPMALVVLSERSPLAALESIVRRCAYVLVPFSIILAKYYPHLGVTYSRWSGFLSWNGVTLQKNALSQLCLLSIFFIIWTFARDKRNGFKPTSKTLADGLIWVIAVYMLFGGPGGYSATSTANFVVIILCLTLFYKMGNWATQTATLLTSGAVMAWVLLIFSESFVSTMTPLVGRDATFTDRIEVWAMALRDAAQHPILGTGFGAYFATDNEFTRTYFHTGHNGLVDVYVELGVVGVIFVLVFLFSFFRKVHRVLNQSFDWGVLGIIFLIITLLANYTESLFIKSSSYMWNTLIFLAVLFSAPHLYAKENGALENKVMPLN